MNSFVVYNERSKTLHYLLGGRNENSHRNIPVSFIGRKIKCEGKHRGSFMQNRTCFHSSVFLQLLETCLEQSEALGPNPAYFRMLLGRWRGKSNKQILEGKWDLTFFSWKWVCLLPVTWQTWTFFWRQAQRVFHTWQASLCCFTDAYSFCAFWEIPSTCLAFNLTDFMTFH